VIETRSGNVFFPRLELNDASPNHIISWRTIVLANSHASISVTSTSYNDKQSNMTDQARWKATVYVGGLSHLVNNASLEAAFLPFGEIADVTIP